MCSLRSPRTLLVVLVPALGSCSGAEGSPPDEASIRPWFRDVSEDSGVTFTCDPGARGRFAMPEIMGGGVALFDADGDGDLDLDLRSGAPGGPGNSTNRFHRNDGRGRFEEATESSGLVSRDYGMGVGAADVDNDGAIDVLLTGLDVTRLSRGRGQRFELDSNFELKGWSTSVAFLDFDRDGFLDLYVARYLRYSEKACEDAAGRRDFCGPKSFLPLTDVFLRNVAGGLFEDVTESVGVSAVSAAGLGVVVDDFDDDGWTDVYVANDGYANDLWRNDEGRRFLGAATERGAAFNAAGQALAGMGVVAADFDLDRRPDLFVTNLYQETNSLYRNAGPSGFSDSTGVSGLASGSKPFTGFGTNAFDLELDGDLDLFVANGRVARGTARPGVALASPWDEYAEPNLIYANDGSGRFTPYGAELATVVAPIEISRGSVVGDLDGDGDLDLVVNNLAGSCRIYRNEVPEAGHWLRARALDPRWNRDALGAVLSLRARSRSWRAVVSTAGSYLAASDPAVHFGLGPAETYDSIEVRWPDGLRERFVGGATDRAVTLVRGSGEALP